MQIMLNEKKADIGDIIFEKNQNIIPTRAYYEQIKEDVLEELQKQYGCDFDCTDKEYFIAWYGLLWLPHIKDVGGDIKAVYFTTEMLKHDRFVERERLKETKEANA